MSTLHRLTFTVENGQHEVHGTIELPGDHITDEVVDAFAALFEGAYGPLVPSRSSVGPAYLWETMKTGELEFSEAGGA